MTICGKVTIFNFCNRSIPQTSYNIFSAISFPIALLFQESVPKHWLKWIPGRRAINIACGVWLLMTYVLTMGYASVLLSSLVKRDTTKPIDTIADFLDSGKQLLIPAKTTIYRSMSIDPRQSIQIIMDTKAKSFPFRGVIPPWVLQE